MSTSVLMENEVNPALKATHGSSWTAVDAHMEKL